MEKNGDINLSGQSSANNDINQIVLKKKVLDTGEENIKEEVKNTSENTSNNIQEKDNKVFGNNKEDFIPKNPDYHSGILETKNVKKERKPSALIIFLIIVAVFAGELIYDAITSKKPTPEEPGITEKDNTNDNGTSDNDIENNDNEQNQTETTDENITNEENE